MGAVVLLTIGRDRPAPTPRQAHSQAAGHGGPVGGVGGCDRRRSGLRAPAAKPSTVLARPMLAMVVVLKMSMPAEPAKPFPPDPAAATAMLPMEMLGSLIPRH